MKRFPSARTLLFLYMGSDGVKNLQIFNNLSNYQYSLPTFTSDKRLTSISFTVEHLNLFYNTFAPLVFDRHVQLNGASGLSMGNISCNKGLLYFSFFIKFLAALKVSCWASLWGVCPMPGIICFSVFPLT